MPTTIVAGREYNVVSYYKPKTVDGKRQLVQVASRLERVEKKDRKLSGRQRRKARKAEKRAAAK